ncbi:DMT family transporter [Arenicella xantha]|uniref:EamA domain-containing membrane protein RarD n=1 Tax=Arenicella xantha TaxID=644221 RepID=A0A395JKU4_9GAMM|nr:DMT family transporter [Arenicella xantha]RBP51413.1 EamA domain-containing membrane protein RarD [Arenicella xantha]
MDSHKAISPTTIGFIFAIASAALFAIRPIFVKLVYAEGVDSTTLIAFRMLFSLPIYVLLLAWFLRETELKNRLNAKNILAISIVGMFGYYAASFLDLLGLQYVTAQLGRMILYIYPTFVVLLGAVFFGERITLRVVISLLITYSGVAIIFGHDLNVFGNDVFTGALFILGAALTFSFYLLFSKSLIAEVGSRLFTCVALIAASTGILIHYALTRSITQPEVTPNALWLILIIAIFCTVIPTFFTTSAVARIGADKTGIVAMAGPAFTSIFAVSVLAESFTIYHATGIALTIAGIAVLKGKP